MVKEKTKPVQREKDHHQDSHFLLLFNDDIHAFDFVIKTLIEVCEHDPIQAEQCTWIAHFKGKCPVKEGRFETLKPLHDEMAHRGLTVSIHP